MNLAKIRLQVWQQYIPFRVFQPTLFENYDECPDWFKNLKPKNVSSGALFEAYAHYGMRSEATQCLKAAENLAPLEDGLEKASDKFGFEWLLEIIHDKHSKDKWKSSPDVASLLRWMMKQDDRDNAKKFLGMLEPGGLKIFCTGN